MNWLRLYTSVVDDAKVQRLSAETFKGWINVLCLARRNGGTLPAVQDVAWALRLPEPDTAHLLDELRSAGLLDETDAGPIPHNWHFRQYDSDSSAERMRRFRENKRAKQNTDTDTEQIQIQSKSRHRKRNGDGLCNVTHEADASFESEFWPAYPRKTGKEAARKAYRKLATSETARKTIADGLKAHLPDLLNREAQFIPYPATFLNQKRYLDAPENTNHRNDVESGGISAEAARLLKVVTR